MYNNNERLQNSTITVGMIDLDKYQKRYEVKEIVRTLEEVPWELITFPLTCPRNSITNNPEDRGYVTIGFVSGYDREAKEFLITVFGRFVDQVADFTDTVVCPMVMRATEGSGNEGRLIINKIVYGPEKDFEYMTRPREDRRTDTRRFNSRRNDNR